jgi:DNA processing protein
MEELFWLALKNTPHVGNITFRRLVDQFGSPECVLRASESELSRVKGVSAAAVASVLTQDQLPSAEKECESLLRSGARIVTYLSPEYPKLLLHIPDAPPFLYVKGQIQAQETAIAIVGSRQASQYGISTTGKLARELALRGITIVSGMARGIDAVAHRCALSAGGRSIGVLGCGIDVVYPRENRGLYAEMIEKGGLVSEFPMGTLPLAENFPRRNRIISGLSTGVLIIEAAEGSGSLITAQCALEQGRDVFAVPGNIQSHNSRGAHRLIKQGAKLVESIEDILDELPHRTGTAETAGITGFVFSQQEAAVYSMLSSAPLHIDTIVEKSALTVSEVSAILLRLEVQGVISQLPGKLFSTL